MKGRKPCALAVEAFVRMRVLHVSSDKTIRMNVSTPHGRPGLIGCCTSLIVNGSNISGPALWKSERFIARNHLNDLTSAEIYHQTEVVRGAVP